MKYVIEISAQRFNASMRDFITTRYATSLATNDSGSDILQSTSLKNVLEEFGNSDDEILLLEIYKSKV